MYIFNFQRSGATISLDHRSAHTIAGTQTERGVTFKRDRTSMLSDFHSLKSVLRSSLLRPSSQSLCYLRLSFYFSSLLTPELLV